MVYNVSTQLCTPLRSLQRAIRGKLVSLDIKKEGQWSFWLWFLRCWRLVINCLVIARILCVPHELNTDFPECIARKVKNMFNIWLLQWDCSVVVFQFLRRTCWSLNKRATTVSSRLFARKGYVTKSWKCSWNQSLWFRIAKVYFWSCVERLWKFTVFKTAELFRGWGVTGDGWRVAGGG